MRDRLKTKKFYKENLPFILMTGIFLVYHLLITVTTGDDVEYFKHALDDLSLLEFIKIRWEGWTSRIIIEVIIVVLESCTLVWKIIDVVLLICIVYMMCKMSGNIKNSWICCFFAIIYPFEDMSTAGWIATTVNYIWPLWGIVYVTYILRKHTKKIKLKWYEYIIGIAAVLIGSNQEQSAIVMLVLLVMICIYQLSTKILNNYYLYVLLILNFISLGVITICPGNIKRKQVECLNRVPNFSEFSVFKKMFLGIANVEREFISNVNVVAIAIFITMAVLVYKKTKSVHKVLISSIPIFITFCHCIVVSAFPIWNKFFFKPEKSFDIGEVEGKSFLIIIYTILTILGFIYACYQLIGEEKICYWGSLGLIGVSYASAVVLGFSPTLYVSAERVFIFFYFSMIFVCYLCVSKTSKHIVFSDIEKKIWLSVCLVWCSFNVLTVLANIFYLRE